MPTQSSQEATLRTAAQEYIRRATDLVDLGGRVMALAQSLEEKFPNDPETPGVVAELRKIEDLMVLDGKEEAMQAAAQAFVGV